MNDHRHNRATDGGGDDCEEDTIVSMEVIRGDWVKVRTARENQIQTLSHDQLKEIANFCAPEQFRSHRNTPPGTSSSNDYKVIIMEVLDYALLASIDVEKTKKKRSRSLDHFKNCLDYIDQVRKNRQSASITANATTTNASLPKAPSAATATVQDFNESIFSEKIIAFNAANNPNIQNKERSSNPKNIGTSARTSSATTASSTAALNTSNNNLVSQSQHSISSPSSPLAAIKPPCSVSSTKDGTSLTAQPASFMSMLQKSTVTTSTTPNHYSSSSKTASKNSLISDSSSASTTLASAPFTTLATSITGTNNRSPNSIPANTNGNTSNQTSNKSLDRTPNSNISAGTKIQTLQSSDLSVHSLLTHMKKSTTATPSVPSVTEPSEDLSSAGAVNGKLNDPLNEKTSERYPGNEKATSSNEMNIMIGNNKANNINNYTKDGPALPLVFDSEKHISHLYHVSPGHRTDNLCTFDIGAALEPYAASLYTRRACRVQYPVPTFPSLIMMHKNGTINVRFNRWDPFYKCQHDIVNFVRDKTTNQILKVQYRDSMGVEQFPVVITSSIGNCTPLDGRGRPTTGAIDANVKPMACLEVNFQFPSDIANLVKSWGYESLGKTANDTNRLICRMLPLDSKAMKTDFADTHLWPKGTYMEVNGKPVVLQQRRQQSHDPTQWKGMCKQLDLTPYVNIPISMNRIKLVAQENACYALQICIAEQRTPLTVFNEVLKGILVIPMAAALEKGKQYVDKQTVCLEHDNSTVSRGRHQQEGAAPGQQEMGETKPDSYHLTFKLVCPISMTVMNEPVRGQQCQHFQCFDLFNFIETNSFPSGRRWKCPCCDSFVSLDSLELCGWFNTVLKIHGSKVSADGIDSVKLFSNGQWELVSSSANNNKRKVDVLPQQQKKRNKVAVEVIEIDLD